MNDAPPVATSPGLEPLSLVNARSFIEHQFPVGRLSVEAYKERKAGPGQTLTALGSYWKGRKPLILVRAVVLGCLLPATADAAADLDIFLKLMAMDDGAFGRRFDGGPTAFARMFPASADLVTEERGYKRRVWRDDLSEHARHALIAEAFATLPYANRVNAAEMRRPEQCDETQLLAPIWRDVNSHLGTTSWNLHTLVEQLGIGRFGRRPKVADTFCGGGSIPFEAARIGCDVYASDLNPIACMLTWGAFNIVGATTERHGEIERVQREVAAAVDAEIVRLAIEHDADGNRAKAYLYCHETRCPKTGWMVPMSPSWIVSTTHRAVARLIPEHDSKRYRIEICSGVTAAEMAEAAQGTVQGGRLVHPMNNERSGVDITTIRGDYRDADGNNRNGLRPWTKSDFKPRADDIFQERLYCIQWITKETVGSSRQETFFSAVTSHDYSRELQVEAIVEKHLLSWQEQGLVPDMLIEPGDKTDEPIRTRGWTYWHHLFGPRDLLRLQIVMKYTKQNPFLYLEFCSLLDFFSKLTQWILRFGGKGGSEFTSHVFSNQALNPFLNWGNRGWTAVEYVTDYKQSPLISSCAIETLPACAVSQFSDIFVTDPPYADAINYHEITEFFIAWLRKNPPPPFDKWTWNSRRKLAIKGKDEQFRRDMVVAYTAMTRHMADNGVQVVMFTHQDAGVWADLAAILWASGLSVGAAWNVVTETEKPSGSGNFVQGTVCLVLRKRMSQANARRMEIEAEIEEAVAAQLARLHNLDALWHERANAEALYTDGDLTLAAYAAALQVVTKYSSIDRHPLDVDLYRKLGSGKKTMLRELIEYAAQVANGLLVPAGFSSDMWRDLGGARAFLCAHA